MSRTRMMIALASSLLVGQIAAAQMMGGGSHPGSSPSNGSNPSGGMNGGMSGGMNGGMTGGGMMGDMTGGMSQSLTIGADGVVYTLRTSVATSTQKPAVEVVAVRPTGTVAWTTRIEGRMTRLEVSGNFLLVASGSGDMGKDGWNQAAGDNASRLIALSAASGSVQWQVSLDGFVAAIEPFSGGVYVLIVQHARTSTGNGMPNGPNGSSVMKRSVAAIDNAGKVLWKLDL